jgi:hypothetical protein
MPQPDTAEHRRLAESESRKADWKDWGPHVSARAWGAVREDYTGALRQWITFRAAPYGKIIAGREISSWTFWRRQRPTCGASWCMRWRLS